MVKNRLEFGKSKTGRDIYIAEYEDYYNLVIKYVDWDDITLYGENYRSFKDGCICCWREREKILGKGYKDIDSPYYTDWYNALKQDFVVTEDWEYLSNFEAHYKRSMEMYRLDRKDLTIENGIILPKEVKKFIDSTTKLTSGQNLPRGVSKAGDKYKVYISYNKKRYYLGRYTSIVEASEVYEDAWQQIATHLLVKWEMLPDSIKNKLVPSNKKLNY